MDDYSGGHGRHRGLESLLTRNVDMSQANYPYVNLTDMDLEMSMDDSVCGFSKMYQTCVVTVPGLPTR